MDSETAVTAWRQFVRALVEHTRGRIQALELPLTGAADEIADASCFEVTAVQARAEDPAVMIGISGPAVSTR